MSNNKSSDNIFFIIGLVIFVAIIIPWEIYDNFIRDDDTSYAAASQVKNDDYNAGYDDGYEDGHDDGYEDGHDDGYEDGHDDGYEDGCEDGFEEGLSFMRSELYYDASEIVSQLDRITPANEEESSILSEIGERAADILFECEP